MAARHAKENERTHSLFTADFAELLAKRVDAG